MNLESPTCREFPDREMSNKYERQRQVRAFSTLKNIHGVKSSQLGLQRYKSLS